MYRILAQSHVTNDFSKLKGRTAAKQLNRPQDWRDGTQSNPYATFLVRHKTYINNLNRKSKDYLRPK